jgi:hypothetical protein
MFFLLAALALDPIQTIALRGETHHVQGVVLDHKTSRAYVTAVDKTARKGFLFEYQLPFGKLLRSVEIQDGDRYHPGGLDSSGDSLWIPVAEYRRDSAAVIQKRSKRTLEIEAQFAVKDHIGCVAVSSDRLYGGNWDSRQIYEWTLDGREIAKRDRVSPVSYQDLKFRAGAIVASGIRALVPYGGKPSKVGAVDFLDPQTLAPTRTEKFQFTTRKVLYTNEGMDFDDRKGLLYLLPEDSPSRLFVFRLPPR